jgi:hypothetical protein
MAWLKSSFDAADVEKDRILDDSIFDRYLI